MTGYDLSRRFFDFCFEHPEKVTPNHVAIYFFAIEQCNRFAWKDKFGFPTFMVMEAIGIKKYQTYIKYLNELVEWGFIVMVEKSTNQYSANVISLKSAMPKNGKALDKANIKAEANQTQKHSQSKHKNMGCIDKQETINQEQANNDLGETSSPTSKKVEKHFNDFDQAKYTPEQITRFKMLNEWIDANVPEIRNIKVQMNIDTFLKLAPTPNETPFLTKKLRALGSKEHYYKGSKKYSNINLVIQNWISDDLNK